MIQLSFQILLKQKQRVDPNGKDSPKSRAVEKSQNILCFRGSKGLLLSLISLGYNRTIWHCLTIAKYITYLYHCNFLLCSTINIRYSFSLSTFMLHHLCILKLQTLKSMLASFPSSFYISSIFNNYVSLLYNARLHIQSTSSLLLIMKVLQCQQR